MTDDRQCSFRCPHCAGALDSVGGGVACSLGHRFDRAAEGYLHLLPSGRRKGSAPGDSAEMIRARREFLDRGHYAPVIAAVAEAVGDVGVVLDAGCGEGSYLGAVSAPIRLGVDVSKPAVRLAARRWASAEFAVASSHRLPLDDHSVDVVMSVFAPRPFDEFRRVLRPGGRLVTASPGPDHLMELRASLYDTPRPHATRPHAADEGVADVARVRFSLHLDPSEAVMLLQMTPYWWTAPGEFQEQIAPSVLTVDILVAAERC